MRPSQLTLQNLTVRYHPDAPAAVAELTLDVAPGELLALLGPSGSGKSSTLRAIAGFAPVNAGGRILLDGRCIAAQPPERREAALVFQQPTLFPHMNVLDNVAFGLLMRCVERRARERDAARMLDAVQLAGLHQRRPYQLSGGQQQRVALARALVTRPRVLLLDEPFAALDPELRDEMRALVRQLQREHRLTTVLVTHDQQEASVMADRIALIIDGRLQQVGPPEDFYARPASLVVARFFGAQNFIRGTLAPDRYTVSTALGPLRLRQPDLAPGPITVVVRPEHVQLDTAGEPSGTITAHQFLGTLHRYTVAVGGEQLVALSTSARFRPGDAVAVHFPPEHLWALAE
jgi:putative spermidine/putrescine transport system ATP-binding protein